MLNTLKNRNLCLFYVVLIPLLIWLTSCGYREDIIQKSPQSFLSFIGNPDGVSVSLDDRTPFYLRQVDAEGEPSSKHKLYQIQPGKHTIKVYKHGDLVVHRVLYLEDGVTTEVRIP